jgi:CheY-like chemotaxis protein/two-component sensor histidine kinase
VLLLASEAADDPEIPESVRKTFESIRNNVSLEARLIDDLLDLTRIAHGKLTLEMKPLDLHTVLREAIGIVSGEIEEKGIELLVRLHPDQTTVMGDMVRLQQVFWNVLKNAIKYTPTHGQISIDTIPDLDGEKVTVRMTDSGIGLADQDLDRIFNAFSQAQPRNGGLGLGLTISRRLIENLGGTIRAASAGRNRGATFEIELPLARRSAATPSPDGKLLPTAAIAISNRKSRALRILLIEDHEPTRTTLQRLLARRKFKVTCRRLRCEARALATDTNPEILISDLGLPDGDGCTLFQELRVELPNLLGIALSGYGMDDDLARSRAAGFATHLTKPIDIDSLARALSSLSHHIERVTRERIKLADSLVRSLVRHQIQRSPPPAAIVKTFPSPGVVRTRQSATSIRSAEA